MKGAITIIFFLFTFYITNAQLVIDRAIVKGNIKIDITGVEDKKKPVSLYPKPISLITDSFFLLSQLGLMDNGSIGLFPDNDHAWVKPADAYKSGKLIRYSIDIIASNKKHYYGKIAFFRALKSDKEQAVTSYYQIAIPDNYFIDATGGKISHVYEYCEDKKINWKSITWIIWLSDAPL